MSVTKEKVKITDKLGFIYEVVFEHQPHLGFTSALYDDRIIAQCELGKIREPYSDDDSEWETYEERFSEWRDEIHVNLVRSCQDYLNSK